MKQKDEIAILYMSHFVNACLTESCGLTIFESHFFGSYIFIAELKNSKIFGFFKSAGLNSQTLGRSELDDFVS